MTKAHILDEIRRTAKANGGVPPGRKAFERETGIKIHDWYGKLWARWGDALREAGFAPNQLQEAYRKTELFEKYAELTEELGRLPTPGDMRLKSRGNPDFPSDRTFA